MTELALDRPSPVGTPPAPPRADTHRRPSFWRRPPGRILHGTAAAAALVLLAAEVPPGEVWPLAVAAVWVLILCASVWSVRLATHAVAAARRRPHGRWRGYLLAPFGGLVVAGLLWANVPMRVGFAVSRPSFDRAAASRGRTDQDTIDSQRIGVYEITQVTRSGDAILFYEANGSFSDDAGFAYLPEGPTDELENTGFERPQWTHLGGHWYAWVASW